VPTAHGGFKRAAAVHRDGLELIASATLFDRLLEGLDGTQGLVADRSTPALRAAGGEEFVSVFKKKHPLCQQKEANKMEGVDFLAACAGFGGRVLFLPLFVFELWEP